MHVEKTIPIEVKPSIIEEGYLEVHAYMDETEVKATVEVVGVGTYETPFTIKIPAGTYTLNATYKNQKQTEKATVEPNEKTTVKFTFKAPIKTLELIMKTAPLIIGTIALTLSKSKT
jgi:ABC-type transport system substrate-binding protein